MEYSDSILDCEQHPASCIDNVARLVKVSKLEPVSVTFGIAEKLKAILLEREGCEFDARQLGLHKDANQLINTNATQSNKQRHEAHCERD